MLELIRSTDEALLRLVLSWPHPVWLNSLMLGASYTGVAGALWLVLGAMLVAANTIPWRDLVRLAIAIGVVYVVVDVVIKPWADRSRPPEAIAGLVARMAVPESRSFPSGHAANAVAAACVLHIIWRRGRRLVWTAAAIVAVARVYLGVHFPVDALAGSLIGAACGWLALRGREQLPRDV